MIDTILRPPVLVAAALASLLSVAPVAAVPQEEVEGWTTDLRFLMTEIPLVHPDAFHRVSREEFEAEILDLEERLGDLQAHEIAVEISRIVALIGDGHTRLTLPLAPGIEFFQGHSKTTAPKIEDLVIRQFPVRFGLFPDAGLVVTAVDREDSEARALLGARVVRIGRLATDEAIEAVRPTIEHDNEWQVRHFLPERLVLAEILHARGVIEDRQILELEAETGSGVRRVELKVMAPGAEISWARAGASAPPSLTQRDEIFSLSEIVPGVLYLRIDEIADAPGENYADLAARVERALAAPGHQRLVIDLRQNRGGNNSLNMPLIHALIRSDDLREPGSLFVLVGRTTFSAAMMLSVDLERHTHAIFVGEPTGSSPNHYGDSRKSRLPFSGLTVRISTREWQYSHPLDHRTAIEPLVPAPLTLSDLLSGRDPAIDAVRSFADAPPTGFEGWWEGSLAYGLGNRELAIELDADGGAGDLPALGLEGLPLNEVRRYGSRVSFVGALGQESFRIVAEVRGRQMIGFLDDRRRGGTLVLRRVPQD